MKSLSSTVVLICQECRPSLQDGGPGRETHAVHPLDDLQVHSAAAGRGLAVQPHHGPPTPTRTHPRSFTVNLDPTERHRQEDSLLVLPFGTCRGSHSLREMKGRQREMKEYELSMKDSGECDRGRLEGWGLRGKIGG